jgi:four helix bundle protein
LLAKSVDLVKNIYLVSQSFPKDEQYGLTGQLSRCAVEIAFQLKYLEDN